jgi:hypothetical protein
MNERMVPLIVELNPAREIVYDPFESLGTGRGHVIIAQPFI